MPRHFHWVIWTFTVGDWKRFMKWVCETTRGAHAQKTTKSIEGSKNET